MSINETTDDKIIRLEELRKLYKNNKIKDRGFIKRYLSGGSWDGLEREQQEYINLKEDLLKVYNQIHARRNIFGQNESNEDVILRIKLTKLLHNEIERQEYSKYLGIKFESPNDTEILIKEFTKLFPHLSTPKVAQGNSSYLKLELTPGQEVEMLTKLAKKNISFSVIDPNDPSKVICRAKNGTLINAVTNQEYQQGDIFNPAGAASTTQNNGAKIKEELSNLKSEVNSVEIETTDSVTDKIVNKPK